MKESRRPMGTKWWPLLGYSQAVTCGNLVRVAATAAAGVRGEMIGKNDPYTQTGQAIANLKSALGAFGAGLEHVVRTRVYVRDIGHWPSIARAYGEAFAEFNPETRVVGTRRFRSLEALVEIEADALVPLAPLRDRRAGPRAVAKPAPGAV